MNKKMKFLFIFFLGRTEKDYFTVDDFSDIERS